jgi:hypothetical protein
MSATVSQNKTFPRISETFTVPVFAPGTFVIAKVGFPESPTSDNFEERLFVM